MPPLKHSDLLPNPPLYDGKSNLLVLAYPMTEDHILWWAHKHHIPPRPGAPADPNTIKAQLKTDAVNKMGWSVPPEIDIVTVLYDSGENDFTWSIAFNTQKGLETAANLELIEKVRKLIGARGPPEWYTPSYYEMNE